MQKIAIREEVNNYAAALDSHEIVETLRRIQSFVINHKEKINDIRDFHRLKDKLVQLIIQSKSQNDNYINESEELSLISSTINPSIYSAESISKLLLDIAKVEVDNRRTLFTELSIQEFFIFHEAVLQLSKVLGVVVTESMDRDDVVIFTVISEDNPSPNTIVEAIEKIQSLIDLVEQIYDEEQENFIYTLDKGSDTNIGFETGVKTAKSLFEIFKEVWDWMVNRKYYKQKLANAAFTENLKIIEDIEEKRKNGSLSDEDAARFKTVFLKNIDELLSINVVPRQVLLEADRATSNKQPLLDYNEVRLLKEGDK